MLPVRTHDLKVRDGAFVLITAKDGANWHREASAVAQKLNIELVPVAICTGQLYADAAGRSLTVSAAESEGLPGAQHAIDKPLAIFAHRKGFLAMMWGETATD